MQNPIYTALYFLALFILVWVCLQVQYAVQDFKIRHDDLWPVEKYTIISERIPTRVWFGAYIVFTMFFVLLPHSLIFLQ